MKLTIIILLFASLALIQLTNAFPELSTMDILMIGTVMTTLSVVRIAPYVGKIFHTAEEDLDLHNYSPSFSTSSTPTVANALAVFTPTFSPDQISTIGENPVDFCVQQESASKNIENTLYVMESVTEYITFEYDESSGKRSSGDKIYEIDINDDTTTSTPRPHTYLVPEIAISSQIWSSVKNIPVVVAVRKLINPFFLVASKALRDTKMRLEQSVLVKKIEWLSYETQKQVIKVLFVLVPFVALYLGFGNFIRDAWNILKPQLRYAFFVSVLSIMNIFACFRQLFMTWLRKSFELTIMALEYRRQEIQKALCLSVVFLVDSIVDGFIAYKVRSQRVWVLETEAQVIERRGKMVQKKLGELRRYRTMKAGLHRRRLAVRAESRVVIEQQVKRSEKVISHLKEEITNLKEANIVSKEEITLLKGLQADLKSDSSRIPELQDTLALFKETRQQSSESLEVIEVVKKAFAELGNVNRRAETIMKSLRRHEDHVRRAHVQMDNFDKTIQHFESREYRFCLDHLRKLTDEAVNARVLATQASLGITHCAESRDLKALLPGPERFVTPDSPIVPEDKDNVGVLASVESKDDPVETEKPMPVPEPEQTDSQQIEPELSLLPAEASQDDNKNSETFSERTLPVVVLEDTPVNTTELKQVSNLPEPTVPLAASEAPKKAEDSIVNVQEALPLISLKGESVQGPPECEPGSKPTEEPLEDQETVQESVQELATVPESTQEPYRDPEPALPSQGTLEPEALPLPVSVSYHEMTVNEPESEVRTDSEMVEAQTPEPKSQRRSEPHLMDAQDSDMTDSPVLALQSQPVSDPQNSDAPVPFPEPAQLLLSGNLPDLSFLRNLPAHIWKKSPAPEPLPVPAPVPEYVRQSFQTPGLELLFSSQAPSFHFQAAPEPVPKRVQESGHAQVPEGADLSLLQGLPESEAFESERTPEPASQSVDMLDVSAQAMPVSSPPRPMPEILNARAEPVTVREHVPEPERQSEASQVLSAQESEAQGPSAIEDTGNSFVAVFDDELFNYDDMEMDPNLCPGGWEEMDESPDKREVAGESSAHGASYDQSSMAIETTGATPVTPTTSSVPALSAQEPLPLGQGVRTANKGTGEGHQGITCSQSQVPIPGLNDWDHLIDPAILNLPAEELQAQHDQLARLLAEDPDFGADLNGPTDGNAPSDPNLPVDDPTNANATDNTTADDPSEVQTDYVRADSGEPVVASVPPPPSVSTMDPTLPGLPPMDETFLAELETAFAQQQPTTPAGGIQTVASENLPPSVESTREGASAPTPFATGFNEEEQVILRVSSSDEDTEPDNRGREIPLSERKIAKPRRRRRGL